MTPIWKLFSFYKGSTQAIIKATDDFWCSTPQETEFSQLIVETDKVSWTNFT